MIVPSLSSIFPDDATLRQNAIVDLGFLSPNTNASSLIDNSTFANTLQCAIATSNGLQNASCVQTCGNITDLFSSWPNFYTCSWYPALSEALNVNPNVSTGVSLGSLGIYSHQEELSSNISSSIATCLADYCQSSSQCQVLDSSKACSSTNLISVNGSSKTLNQSSAASCLRYGVCGTTDEVNPDIGGLGIAQYRTQQGPAGQAATEALSQAEEKLKGHLEALTSGLVEFQKSQCFFAATLQVAALIVLTPYLQQVQAANSFAPIMLSLAHIEILAHRNSKCTMSNGASSYLLLLSSICFILGTAVYWNADPDLTGGSLNVYNEYANPAIAIMSCGNLAPFAPCFVGLAVWIMTFLIWIYRVLYATATTVAFSPLFKQAWDGLKKLSHSLKLIWRTTIAKIPNSKHLRKLSEIWKKNKVVQESRKWFTKLAAFIKLKEKRFWNYLQLVLGTAALLIQLTSIIEVLVFSSNLINTQMTFGQIVAVGIWIPVMLEYAYLEINGAEEGTEYRLKSPLVVTNPTSGPKTPAPQPSPSQHVQNTTVPKATLQPSRP
ncbi:hypothetical protein V8E51_011647 [Hyaloscypha variabilis]